MKGEVDHDCLSKQEAQHTTQGLTRNHWRVSDAEGAGDNWTRLSCGFYAKEWMKQGT